MKKSVLVAAMAATAATGVSTVAVAEEAKEWTGEASLTYILNRGNTSGETFGGKVKTVGDWEKWRVTGKLEGLNQSDESGRTGEKYFASAKLDRKLDEVSYIFALLEHDDDRFSGFHYQTSVTGGYGRTVLDDDTHKLSLEAGPGYRRSEVEVGDKVQEEAFARAAANYLWNVSETSVFTQDLSVEAGDESTITKSATKLKTKINSDFSLTLGHDIKRNSDVPEGTKNSDSTTYVTLDYSF